MGFLWGRSGKALHCDMRRMGEHITAQGRYVLAVDDGNAYLAAGLDPMPLYVAFPPNRHVSAKLRVFIEWVAELMGQDRGQDR